MKTHILFCAFFQVTIPHLNENAASIFSRTGKSTGDSCGKRTHSRYVRKGCVVNFWSRLFVKLCVFETPRFRFTENASNASRPHYRFRSVIPVHTKRSKNANTLRENATTVICSYDKSTQIDWIGVHVMRMTLAFSKVSIFAVHTSDRAPFSNVSTLESVFECMRFR